VLPTSRSVVGNEIENLKNKKEKKKTGDGNEEYEEVEKGRRE